MSAGAPETGPRTRRFIGIHMPAPRVLFLAMALAFAGDPALATAQELSGSLRVELGVEPREVTVGDPFRAIARVTVPAGYSVRYLDFVSGDSVAALAPVELIESTDANSIAVYTLVAWAAGPEVQALAGIEVTGPDGRARIHDYRLQLPRVVSVLPPDSTGIEPRPAKGLLSVPVADRFPWWWIAVLLLLAAIAWLVYRALNRRVASVPSIDPREWALRQLSDEHLVTILRPQEHAALASHVSHVLRAYIERVRPQLGRDLTSTELLAALARNPLSASGRATQQGMASEIVTSLGGMLRLADRVKFAAYVPRDEEAASLLSLARDWIGRWPQPIESSPATRRAA